MLGALMHSVKNLRCHGPQKRTTQYRLSISTTTNGYCWVPAVAGMTPRRSSQRRAVISISTSFPGRENPSTSSISAFSSGTGASAATVSSRSSGS